MNLAEKLLKLDSGEFTKKKTKKMKSRVLSEILGEDAYVTLREISPQEFLDLQMPGLDENGDAIVSKTLDTNSRITAGVVVDPPLKDETLMKHFGVATPAEAAMKLFKGEVNAIAIEASKMAGFGSIEETDEEIKNS